MTVWTWTVATKGQDEIAGPYAEPNSFVIGLLPLVGTVGDAAPSASDHAEGSITNPWGEFVELADDLTATTFDDETVVPGNWYRYRVGFTGDEGSFSFWSKEYFLGNLGPSGSIADDSPSAVDYVQGEALPRGAITDEAPAAFDKGTVVLSNLAMDVSPRVQEHVPALIIRPALRPLLKFPVQEGLLWTHGADGRRIEWEYRTNNFVEQEAAALRRERLTTTHDMMDGVIFNDMFFLGGSGSGVARNTTWDEDAGLFVASLGSGEPFLAFLDSKRGFRQTELPFSTVGFVGVARVAFSPNKAFLAMSTANELMVYDTATWTKVTIPLVDSYANIAWAPNSTMLAATTGSDTIDIIVDIGGTASVDRTLTTPSGILSMAFSPDGSYFAVAHSALDGNRPFSVYTASGGWSVTRPEINDDFSWAQSQFVTWTPNSSYLIVTARNNISFDPPQQDGTHVLVYTAGSWAGAHQAIISNNGQPTSIIATNDYYIINRSNTPGNIKAISARRIGSGWGLLWDYEIPETGPEYEMNGARLQLSADERLLIGTNNRLVAGSGWVRFLEADSSFTPGTQQWWNGSEWVASEVFVPLSTPALNFLSEEWSGVPNRWRFNVATREAQTGLDSAYALDAHRFYWHLNEDIWSGVTDAAPSAHDHVQGFLGDPSGAASDRAPSTVDHTVAAIIVRGTAADVGHVDPDTGVFATDPTLVAPVDDVVVDGSLAVNFEWIFNTVNADVQDAYALWVEGYGWWNGTEFVGSEVFVESSAESVAIPPSAWV